MPDLGSANVRVPAATDGAEFGRPRPAGDRPGLVGQVDRDAGHHHGGHGQRRPDSRGHDTSNATLTIATAGMAAPRPDGRVYHGPAGA